jgi:hypothetical protein
VSTRPKYSGKLHLDHRIAAGSVEIAGPFPELGRLSTETSVFTDTNVS